jgi:hypothetical protein
VEMGVVEMIEEEVLTARDEYLEENSPSQLRHLLADVGALWPKLDHLIYFPVLELTRPRDLYYYQGDGLEAIYDFTYKYMTMEHFLGQLTRVRISAPLAEGLARTYAQACYPGDDPLTIFADWHVKPHWTKFYSHAGHVTMWGRVMPGTKQMILSGPNGWLLGGWNHPIDTHMSHILIDLETALGRTLGRPVGCTITDSEGGGLPVGERYAEAEQHYISVLHRERSYDRTDFELEGPWELVRDDPEHKAAFARWASPQRAAEDPRRFVLMRPVEESEPTRIYTGRFADDLTAGEVPWLHRLRWANNELRIRDLIRGANLNANFGYTYEEVPNRTRQREWEEVQAKVATTERQLNDHQEAVRNLRQRLVDLQNAHTIERREVKQQLARQRLELRRRRREGRATKRACQRVGRLRRELEDCTARFRRRQRKLLRRLYEHETLSRQLRERLTQRIAARDTIDTETLCRERDLEKDQIMLNFQILLANLHDWVAQNYFAPEWRALSLEKATQMIYRKAGWVKWYDDRIEVELEPYRYADQQRAMEATCARFNASNLLWRDGRALRISVAAAD